MANNSLSNSFDYTIRLTPTEYKKHQRLIYIGSLMSQFLTQSYFCQEPDIPLSYETALHEITQFITTGKRYSRLWDQLAIALQPTLDKAQQEPPKE